VYLSIDLLPEVWVEAEHEPQAMSGLVHAGVVDNLVTVLNFIEILFLFHLAKQDIILNQISKSWAPIVFKNDLQGRLDHTILELLQPGRTLFILVALILAIE